MLILSLQCYQAWHISIPVCLLMQAGDEGLATTALPAEGFNEEEQAQADQEQAARATAEAAAAELMAEEQQAQAKQQQAAVKAAAKKAKKQEQKAKKQLQLQQAESSDQPTPSESSQLAPATAASDHPNDAPDNALDSSTDLIQAMRPVTAQHTNSVSPQIQIEIGAMQQQQQQQQQHQGLLNKQTKAGTDDPDSKVASLGKHLLYR
jgi:hypothetical protein